MKHQWMRPKNIIHDIFRRCDYDEILPMLWWHGSCDGPCRATFVAGWRVWDKVPLKALATHPCWIDDDLVWVRFCYSLEQRTFKALLPGHSYGLFRFRMISIVFSLSWRILKAFLVCHTSSFLSHSGGHTKYHFPRHEPHGASRSLMEPQGVSRSFKELKCSS